MEDAILLIMNAWLLRAGVITKEEKENMDKAIENQKTELQKMPGMV